MDRAKKSTRKTGKKRQKADPRSLTSVEKIEAELRRRWKNRVWRGIDLGNLAKAIHRDTSAKYSLQARAYAAIAWNYSELEREAGPADWLVSALLGCLCARWGVERVQWKGMSEILAERLPEGHTRSTDEILGVQRWGWIDHKEELRRYGADAEFAELIEWEGQALVSPAKKAFELQCGAAVNRAIAALALEAIRSTSMCVAPQEGEE